MKIHPFRLFNVHHIQNYYIQWKELFSHSDNCWLTTICCTIVLKLRLTTNMIFGMCNIWVIRRRNFIYLYSKKSYLDQLFHCQSFRIWCH
jgi:ABC-type sulfate transport system permease subunit